MSNKFPLVTAGLDGAVLTNMGRYHRQAVSTAFEMIGGIDRLAAWADANPGDFYKSLYTKIIPREVEVQASEGVEDLLRQLDAKMIDVTPKETTDDSDGHS